MINIIGFEDGVVDHPEFDIEWVSKDKKATQPPNPMFPTGIILADPKLQPGEFNCTVDLDYPAPCIGTWKVRCRKCGAAIGCTAAGRPDDPRQMIVRCKNQPPLQQ